MNTKELLERYFSNFDNKLLNSYILKKFYVYLDEIKKYNNILNLTSIRADKEIIVKHFIDSIYILKHNNISHCETLLDVGSGAGFPGIPISIIFPKMKLTLLESNNNKILFLRHIIRKLNLRNIDILNDRAEIIAKIDKYREKFDFCTIRAFLNFNISLEITSSFIKNHGLICFYVSQNQVNKIVVDQTIFKVLGMNIDYIHNYELPDNYGMHSIIFVKKLWKTPDIYPRIFKKIKKNPL